MVATCVIGGAAYPLAAMVVSGSAGRHETTLQPMASGRAAALFDFVRHEAGWVDEFEHFAARQRLAADDRNVVEVAKAVPGSDVSPDGRIEETVEPKDVPKQPIAAADDDAPLKTGSIGPQRPPLLPPVPGPDDFKVEKTDRLGAQRVDQGLLPTAAPAALETTAPHAEIAPVRFPAVKSARLLPMPADKLKTFTVAALKPLVSTPPRPDTLFQGPPMPGDPRQDPDAPVLGYAEQLASAEAPFKALFAVTPADRHSWLAVDQSPPKAKATKPVKLAHATHRRTRRHEA